MESNWEEERRNFFEDRELKLEGVGKEKKRGRRMVQ